MGNEKRVAVERIVDVHGIRSKETSYYISSSEASAGELLEAVCEHWKIESMHWLLDVAFSEDESRFLSENVHTAMNALRKFQSIKIILPLLAKSVR